MSALTIGIASFENPSALDRTMQAIRHCSRSDWHLTVFDNASQDEGVRQVIARHCAEEPRITAVWNQTNVGYCGAINAMLLACQTDYFLYFDNDATIQTIAYDLAMMQTLDAFHEVGLLFPRPFIHYPIPRPAYDEVLWGAGCCWIVNMLAAKDVWTVQEEFFDRHLGHHEEVDFCTRIRMAGWKIAAQRDVFITHEEHASRSPEANERINRGVVNWMHKNETKFGGKLQNYYSPNVMRYPLWPPHALYLEEYFLRNLPQDFNENPEEVVINGERFDLIKVPRTRGFYRRRII